MKLSLSVFCALLMLGKEISSLPVYNQHILKTQEQLLLDKRETGPAGLAVKANEADSQATTAGQASNTGNKVTDGEGKAAGTVNEPGTQAKGGLSGLKKSWQNSGTLSKVAGVVGLGGLAVWGGDWVYKKFKDEKSQQANASASASASASGTGTGTGTQTAVTSAPKV